MNNEKLLKNLRCIPDFPIPGVNFRDVTTLFKNAECVQVMEDELYELYKDKGITKIVGIESRGFVMASALAVKLGAGIVLCRKPGKLPAETVQESYTKEYGVETIDELAERVPNLREDMCASLQATVVDILMRKLKKAANDLKIKSVAVAGGVSANSALRQAFVDYGKRYHWDVFIPPFSFTTDNAAMVCQAGYFKYLDHDFCAIDEVPFAKTRI